MSTSVSGVNLNLYVLFVITSLLSTTYAFDLSTTSQKAHLIAKQHDEASLVPERSEDMALSIMHPKPDRQMSESEHVLTFPG
ncbi:hypothetical protein SCP_1601620 [Sparassis crispa]|uniref:Uncharacterized protein n=1 Tax=Sparassis crispa TaxID=139825 RepID=A0A401H572_9APHY|nr:hypothetical protein SCP_1601620 [Sparassis crispa]GBE89500.1 hypothetical protein SCP_1601620 [Sparassis crispa]